MPLELIRQSNFNGGELSPQAIGRRDLKAYASSLALSINMVARPEGPMTRRPGLRHVDLVRNLLEPVAVEAAMITTPNGGDPATALDGTGLITTTPLGTTDPYVVLEIDFGVPTRVGVVDLANVSLYPAVGTPPGGDEGQGTDPSPPQYPWTGGGIDRPTEVLP